MPPGSHGKGPCCTDRGVSWVIRAHSEQIRRCHDYPWLWLCGSVILWPLCVKKWPLISCKSIYNQKYKCPCPIFKLQEAVFLFIQRNVWQNSVIRYSGAERPWLTNRVLRMLENMFILTTLQKVFSEKIWKFGAKQAFLIIVNHIAITISAKIITITSDWK